LRRVPALIVPELIVLAVLPTAWGCSADGGPAGDMVAERDSAGIHVVENPAASVDRALTASPEPVLSIGVVDGEPEYQLFQVSAAARLSDGGVVVANAGSREVRFYGPDGRHRATAGGSGQGPGEFRYPAAIVVEAGDTVVVQDRLDRVRFSPDGAFLGRETTDRGQLMDVLGPEARAEGGTWLPDGSFFTPVYQQDQMGVRPPPGPPFRPGMTLVRVRADRSGLDTLGVFGGIQQQFVEVGGTFGSWPIVPPFGANTSWAFGSPDGTILVADSETPQFHLFRPDGSHVLVRWPVEREPVTQEEVAAWKEAQRNASWAQRQLPQLERGWAGMDVPDVKAAFGSMVAMGRDGSVWIPESSDYQADPAVFLSFTPEGRLRGRFAVPGPFRIMDGGEDWVLGIHRDENEVEFLRMYQVGG
jgi:hypothetical protein